MHGFLMSYEIQTFHPIGEELNQQQTLISLNSIRENLCNPWLKIQIISL